MTILVAFVLASCGFQVADDLGESIPIVGSHFAVEPNLDETDPAVQVTQATVPSIPFAPAALARPPAFPGSLRPLGTDPSPPTLRPRMPAPLSSTSTALRNPDLFSQTEGRASPRPLGDFSRGGIPQMIGDVEPFASLRAAVVTPVVPQPFPPNPLPNPPSPRLATSLVSSVRSFKIAENQSPRPQDRVFVSFNYFSNVNAAVNARLDTPVRNLSVYREIFGFEKTFDGGNGSFGLRLPLNTLSAISTVQGNFNKPGGTSTALGDLSIFGKYIFRENRETGSLVSAGLVVTPPTAGGRFAGANYIQSINSLSIQPFLGYIWARGDFYLQGFSSLDVPSTIRDVTMLYNDIGFGYFLLQDQDPDHFLTAVVPTFEIHTNIPMTHRDPFNGNDAVGSPDVVNLTYGTNFEFYKQSVLTLGFVTPVTSPKPFAYEAIVLFNYRFGGSRGLTRPVTPPIIPGG